MRALELTPFARAEFNDAYTPTDDLVERARRLLIRSFMGHGSDGAHSPYRTGFRANANKNGTIPAHDWVNFAPALAAVVDRFRWVLIEQKDALSVIAQQDGEETLHYVDPPYVHDTRARSGRRPGAQTAGVYAHEMTDADHAALLEALKGLAGMVVLSGYPHPMYDDALLPAGWFRTEKKALADGARERTEVLWINPACREARLREQPDMFAGGGA